MKKIILTVVAVTTLTIYSCKKTAVTPTEITPVSNVNENNDENTSQRDGIEPFQMTIWHDNLDPDGVVDEDFGCWDYPGNCFPGVVIIASMPPIDDVIDVIDSGTDTEIINAFVTNYEAISAVVIDDHIDGVIDGDLTVSVRGDDPEEKVFLKFWDVANDELKVVYPITIE